MPIAPQSSRLPRGISYLCPPPRSTAWPPSCPGPVATCKRPRCRAVGAASRRAVDQREGSRLPVPGRALPGARDHPAGAAVLRSAGLPGPVLRCPALAGPLRRGGRRSLVLLPRAALTSAAVAVAMFGLGAWSFAIMREFQLGGIHQGPPGAVPRTAQGRQPGTVPQALTRQADVSQSRVPALERVRGAKSPDLTRREP